MNCKNCGLPKEAHIEIPSEFGSRRVWKCPNDSGTAYPATIDIKVELHYQAGEEHPWIAKWVHPETGPGEVVSMQPANALELAGREIERRSAVPTVIATVGAHLR
jgi:hypothetical protein